MLQKRTSQYVAGGSNTQANGDSQHILGTAEHAAVNREIHVDLDIGQ
jgi:hypothetical protein